MVNFRPTTSVQFSPVVDRNGAYGCPLGSLANEIADHDEDSRRAIAMHFDTWHLLFIDALDELKRREILRPDADSHSLANGLLAALQGGYLLAKTTRDVRPMQAALDMAIAQVRSHATENDAAV